LQAAKFAGVADEHDVRLLGGTAVFARAVLSTIQIGILSEAASANLMSPVYVTREKMQQDARGARGLASRSKTATNHPQAWQPQKWSAGDIAAMERLACRSVLQMAAKVSRRLSAHFTNSTASILRERQSESAGGVCHSAGQGREEIVSRFVEILLAQGVEVYRMTRELHASIPAMHQARRKFLWAVF
jgi:hypothetical protein